MGVIIEATSVSIAWLFENGRTIPHATVKGTYPMVHIVLGFLDRLRHLHVVMEEDDDEPLAYQDFIVPSGVDTFVMDSATRYRVFAPSVTTMRLLGANHVFLSAPLITELELSANEWPQVLLQRVPRLTKFVFHSGPAMYDDNFHIAVDDLPSIRHLHLDACNHVTSDPLPTLEELEVEREGLFELTTEFLRGSPALRKFNTISYFVTSMSPESIVEIGNTNMEYIAIDTIDEPLDTCVILPPTCITADLSSTVADETTFSKAPRLKHLMLPDYAMQFDVSGDAIDWDALEVLGTDLFHLPNIVPTQPVDGTPHLLLILGMHCQPEGDHGEYSEQKCVAALKQLKNIVDEVVVCTYGVGFDPELKGSNTYRTERGMMKAIKMATGAENVVFVDEQAHDVFIHAAM